MNTELQIDDLTRGINDDEPAFKGEGQAEQGTAHPGDKCWQDFMAYLEAPTDGNGKADRLVCKLDRDLAAIVRSFFENHLFRLAQYRREKKSLFNNYNPESHA